MHVLQVSTIVSDVPAEEQLRRNVRELMKTWKWNQVTLARKIGRSQSWLSRRLKAPSEMTDDDKDDEKNDHGTRFQFSDLDALAAVFRLSPAELLQPKYGKWDRRSGRERRSGLDRRGYGTPTPDDGSDEQHHHFPLG